MMSRIEERQTGQRPVSAAAVEAAAVVIVLMHVRQAQCPHGMMAASQFFVKQIGQFMDGCAAGAEWSTGIVVAVTGTPVGPAKDAGDPVTGFGGLGDLGRSRSSMIVVDGLKFSTLH